MNASGASQAAARFRDGEAGVALGAYLTRLIWIALGPLFGMGLLLAYWHVMDVRNDQVLTAQTAARSAAQSVDRALRSRIRGLTMLAEALEPDEPKRLAEAYRLAQGFLNAYDTHVVLADTKGQMRLNTRVPLGAPLSALPVPKGRAAAPQALATGRPAVGDSFIGPQAGVLLVAVAVPVLRDGRASGVLLSTLEAGSLRPFLTDAALPDGWTIALRDGTGRIISSGAAAPAEPGAGSADGTVRSLAPLDLAPWTVAVEIPAALARQPVRDAALALALGLALATAAGVLGGAISSRRLSRAIGALAQPAGTAGRDQAADRIVEVAAARHRLDEGAEQRRQAESELAERERSYRMLFKQHPHPMWALSPRTLRFLAVNEAAVRHYGWSREEFAAMTVLDLLPLEEHPRMKLAANLPIPAGPVRREGVWTHRTRDGRRVHVEMSWSEVEFDGQPARLTLAMDVTEKLVLEEQRARALEQAVQSRSLLSETLDRMGDGFVALDRDMRFTFANRRAVAAVQMESSEQMIGRPLLECYRVPQDHPVPQAIRRALSQGRADVVEHRSLQTGRWFETHIYPSDVGVTMYFVDVDDRRTGVQRLRDSEQRYRELFDANPSPMAVWDLETGRILAVNDAAVRHYGYSREEFLSMSAADLRPPEDRERFRQAQALAIAQPAAADREQEQGTWRHVCKDGRVIEVELHLGRMHLEGRPARVVQVTDVTERRRLERAADADAQQRTRALATLREVTSRVSDGFIALDRRYRFTYANAQALKTFGCHSEAELLGRLLFSRFPVPPDDPLRLAMAEALERNTMQVVEHESFAGGVWFETRIYPSADGLSAYFTDITQRRLAELALRASEARFRALFENSPDMILFGRPDGRLLAANPAACDTLGMSQERLCMLTRRDLFDAEDPRTAAFVARRAAAGSARGELTMRRGDGSLFPVESTSVRFLDAEGEPMISSIVRDISERKAAETALRRSEQRFRTLAEQLPAILYIASADGSGPAVYVSPGIGSLGYTAAQWTSAEGPNWHTSLHPDDSPGVMQHLQAAHVAGEELNVAFRLRDAAGVWHHFIETGRFIEGEDGRPLVQGVMLDVTDLKRTEQALREAEAYQRSLFEAMADGVLLLDAQRRVLDANPAAAAMHARPRTQLLGVALDELLVERDRGRAAQAVAGDPAQGAPALLEWEQRRADGSTFPAEVSVRPAGQGRHVAVLRDVTERRDAQRALMAYQMELSELAQRLLTQERETTHHIAQALHDHLGQSLATARLHLDAARVGLGDAVPAALRQEFERVGRTLDQAIADVRVVLGELRPPMLQEQGLLAALDDEMRPRRTDAGELDVLLEVDPAVLPRRWPPDVEYAAFMIAREAVVNAQLHARATLVRVIVDGDGHWLLLEVVDDGAGIPQELRQGRPGHLGLVGMRERALAIGAKFEVGPAEGGGTRIALRWTDSVAP